MNKHSLFLPLYAGMLLLASVHNFLYPVEQQVALKFSDLRAWAETNSPVYKLIEEQSKLKLAEVRLDLDLQATNPQFGYSRESIKNNGIHEVEQVLYLSKSLEMPWIHSKRRKGWQWYKQAVLLSKENQIRRLLMEMKTGYTNLALMKIKMQEFNRVNAVLKELTVISQKRKQEGFLAAYEERLINVAAHILEARILRLSLEVETVENRWKQTMGIGPDQKIHLESVIIFKPLRLEEEKTYEGLNKKTPGFQMWPIMQKGLEMQTALEKLSFLPEITFSGGYKEVNDFKGYTFGLSFPIPLLNRNKAAVQKQQLNLSVHRREFQQFQKEEARQIREILTAVNRIGHLLQQMSQDPPSPSVDIGPVVSAFREGTVSISNLLSALQVHVDGMEEYNSLVTEYYSYVFQLEVLTSQQLVDF